MTLSSWKNLKIIEAISNGIFHNFIDRNVVVKDLSEKEYPAYQACATYNHSELLFG